MKVCVILLLAVCGIHAQNVTMSYIHNRWKQPVAAFTKECLLESHVKPRILDEFHNSANVPDDDSWKCHIKCYAQKLQFMNDAGEIDIPKWADTFEYLDLALAQKCAEIEAPDLCEKTYLLLKCVDDELSKKFPP